MSHISIHLFVHPSDSIHPFIFPFIFPSFILASFCLLFHFSLFIYLLAYLPIPSIIRSIYSFFLSFNPSILKFFIHFPPVLPSSLHSYILYCMSIFSFPSFLFSSFYQSTIHSYFLFVPLNLAPRRSVIFLHFTVRVCACVCLCVFVCDWTDWWMSLCQSFTLWSSVSSFVRRQFTYLWSDRFLLRRLSWHAKKERRGEWMEARGGYLNDKTLRLLRSRSPS